jgi:chromate transporter
LKLVAVAVVAQAVWGMGRVLCPDRVRLAIALGAASLLAVFNGAGIQIVVMAAGAVVGWCFFRKSIDPGTAPTPQYGRAHYWAGAILIAFLSLLVILPVVAKATGSHRLAVFSSFFRSGSLVFGGGHVVLPLLRAELVPPGWISDDAFLAGYGVAQALPGPLFAFSGYLGTAMPLFSQSWLGGVWCALAIFLPAWMLVGGTLPFWHRFQNRIWMKAALRGANASVVGILLAALFNPIWSQTVATGPDFAVVVGAFALLEIWKWPPWLVVLLGAFAGSVLV